MDSDRVLTKLSYAIMKLGLVVFLFPFFWQFISNSGLDSGSSATISILLTVVYIALAFVIFVLSKENFNVFGFSIVLVASISMFFYIWFKMGIHDGMAPYFMLICISVYFMTKINRSR